MSSEKIILPDKYYLEYFKYLIDVAVTDPFTEDWYRGCFNRKSAQGKVIGDITPEYSTIPSEGISYIKELCGEHIKIIYILREPVDRALSQIRMNLSRHHNGTLTPTVWMKYATDPIIKQRGDYKTYIPKWKENIPKNNLLIVDYANVKENPNKVLSEICDFLSIDSFVFPSAQERIHKSKVFKVPASVLDYLKEELSDQTTAYNNEFSK